MSVDFDILVPCLVTTHSFASAFVIMIGLRELLLQPAFTPETVKCFTPEAAGKPILTHQAWVKKYPEVQYLQHCENPDQATINGVFGEEDALEEHLLNRTVSPLNAAVRYLQSEGDSDRAFYTNVSLPVQLAFQTAHGTPCVIQRSGSAPPASTVVGRTVAFTWRHGDRCLIVGVLKKQGIIDPAM